MSQSTRILVTGLSGFLGRALAQEAPANAELIGTTRLLAGNEPADRSASWAECDLEDPADVEKISRLRASRPKISRLRASRRFAARSNSAAR